ncbi:MAG: AAA family ATPase [Frankia sp.]|nr:AAA family ATPase [Frankia sp.]
MDALEVSPFQPTILGATARRWGLVLTITLVLAVAGYAAGVAMAGSTAKASIVVSDPNAAIFDVDPEPNYAANQASILRLQLTADAAAQKVNEQIPGAGMTGKDLREHLTVELDEDSDLIEVKVEDSDPAIAAAAANAMIAAYQEQVRARVTDSTQTALQQLDGQIQQLQTQILQNQLLPNSPQAVTLASLQEKRSELYLRGLLVTDGIVATSPAEEPEASSAVGALRYAVLGAVVGLLVGMGVSYVSATRNRRVANRLQPELVLDRPLLAEIADFDQERLPSDLPAFDGEQSAAAEGFRFAFDALQPGKTYAVISPATGDGRSVVAANLAVTAAKSGRRVLAIDASPQGSGLSWLLGVSTDRPGLAQVARGTLSLQDAVASVEQVQGDLSVLTPGVGGPAGGVLQLTTEQSAAALAAAKEAYDLVLVDTPALLEKSLASVLASQADSNLIVIAHGAPATTIEEFAKRVAVSHLPVLGYLYTRSPLRGKRGSRKSGERRTGGLPGQRLIQSRPAPAPGAPVGSGV